ncbi:MAG: hypothetical protein JW821_16200, partial [Deltaproteobacteria bacterium]|nr:hypothetical protein [Deltaproteobacteria bacterium]
GPDRLGKGRQAPHLLPLPGPGGRCLHLNHLRDPARGVPPIRTRLLVPLLPVQETRILIRVSIVKGMNPETASVPHGWP